MKKIVIVGFGVVLIVLAVVLIARIGSQSDAPDVAAAKVPVSKIAEVTPAPRGKRVAKSETGAPVRSSRHRTRRDLVRDPNKRDTGPELSPQEEALRLAIGEGMNNTNFVAVQALYDQAVKSDKVEIRLALVDALGSFGKQALPELTGLLADPSEEVVFEATSQWQSALYEIEDDKEKSAFVALAMKRVASEELLDDMGDELNRINNVEALRAITDVITDAKSGKAGVAAAKRAYETVTGDAWKDVDTAEAWLQKNRNDEE